MNKDSSLEDTPEILRLTNPERYYDLYIAPRVPIKAKCMKCGYNKMFHDTESDLVVCGRCGGEW